MYGYDTHLDLTNVDSNNLGEVRKYMFALPIGEGEFVTYVNRTSGNGGDWDFVSSEIRELETQLTIDVRIDDVGYVAPDDEAMYIELGFSM